MTTALEQYRQDFIRLALACNVLQFGEFELKSGRLSPYFFNAGKFASGSSLAQLGRCYAAAFQAANLPTDMLFGPAYKGIPLVATTAIALADHHGPVYLRFGRPKVANFTPENGSFTIGKAVELQEGTDVTIIATGHLVWEALQACKTLKEQGISAEVINIHTIKPLDGAAILKSVAKTRCVVTAEEHNYLGGLGESVSRILAENNPVPQEFVATQDTFGESGTPDQLMEKYGLNAAAIVRAATKVVARK